MISSLYEDVQIFFCNIHKSWIQIIFSYDISS
jgi:hypothetical protein